MECKDLTSINLESTVITSIGRSAFLKCSSLASITLPNTITSIGDGAFGKCTSLTTVTALAITPPSVGTSSFHDAPLSTATLYVPFGAKKAYASANGWQDFGTILELEPTDAPYTLTVSDLTYATLYLHYNAQIPDGMKVYVGKSTDYGYLQLEEITGTIPANTGVLIQAPAGSYQLPITTASAQATSILQGVNEDTSVESCSTLVLSEHDGQIGFYRYGGTTLHAHRAYLPISAAHNGAIRISMPDAITAVSADQVAPTQLDLFGHRLRQRQHGLNIENGKLIYIK